MRWNLFCPEGRGGAGNQLFAGQTIPIGIESRVLFWIGVED